MENLLHPLKKAVKQTPLWPLLRPRRIHVYGVGAPKTGTLSIARLFSEHYRSVHERYLVETTRLLQKRKKETLSKKEIAEEVRQRERKQRFECESAYYLAHISDVLAETFSHARFILTVREPRSWLRSIIDQHIRNPRAKLVESDSLRWWVMLRDLCFGTPPSNYNQYEVILGKRNLYAIDAYLSYWARHNRRVLDAVPTDRLLVVRTRDLSDSIDRIAAFAGIPPDMITREKSHSNKAPKKYELVDEIDDDYLQGKIDEHCSEVMNRLENVTAVSF